VKLPDASAERPVRTIAFARRAARPGHSSSDYRVPSDHASDGCSSRNAIVRSVEPGRMHSRQKEPRDRTISARVPRAVHVRDRRRQKRAMPATQPGLGKPATEELLVRGLVTLRVPEVIAPGAPDQVGACRFAGQQHLDRRRAANHKRGAVCQGNDPHVGVDLRDCLEAPTSPSFDR
jgi:hypothetical protein